MTSEQTDRLPTVKLRPGKGRRLASGAPWVFQDEIALDRRTRALAPGTLAILVDGDQALGVAAINPESRISARLLDRSPEAIIDGAWFRTRLQHALAARERLFDAPFYRLVHAEGDGLPAIVVDRFGDVAVVQPNAAWADRLEAEIVDAVADVTGCSAIVVNGMSRARRQEGLTEEIRVVRGTVDAPVPVIMNDATYMADVLGGQKTGLFYDQRPNHAFVRAIAADASVLDVFSHVGGFGLAALAGGARRVEAVDSSATALALANEGAARMGVGDRFETHRADAFDALREREGEPHDIVVCDPPAFAPSRNTLNAGLRAYERVARLAAARVSEGGILVLCSCSHAATSEAFHRACVDGIRRAGRRAALIYSGRAGPDHPVHSGLPETAYLKALAFRLVDDRIP